MASSTPETVAPQSHGLDIERIRNAFPTLSRMIGDEPLVYLDSGASAQRVLASIEAVDRYERRHHANVHRGSHTLSGEATDAYEGARATVADHLGARDRREIVFVRNATEAINLVARAWGGANVGAGDRIVLTEMEHHSNIVPWQQLAAASGAAIDWVGVDDRGELIREELEAALAREPKLVAVTHISNVLGTLNPIAEIASMAHDVGALILVDGAQAMPKTAIDVAELGVDFYAVTGHKAYGPTGIGVLHGRRSILEAMPPFLGGGHMIARVGDFESTWAEPPTRFEAGTMPIAEAIGLGEAVEWLASIGMEHVREHGRDVTAYALERLGEVPGLSIHGPAEADGRGSLISFALDAAHPHDVAEILGREGVCVRAGHHCAQPLMRRLGVPASTRASFAVHATRDDVDRLIDALGTVQEIFA